MASPYELTISSGLGLFAGGLSGFLGLGGGAILTPLLVFALGVDQHRAQGISLAALLPPVGLPAVLAYHRRGVRIALRVVALLVLGFVVGAYGGAWLAHRVPARELRWVFATFLVISAFRAATTHDEDAPLATNARPRHTWAAAPIGLFAGVMSGLLGVGGGIVALPLLRRFAGLSRLEAQATTLAMLLPPIGLPAVYVYAKEQGGLPWELLVAVAIGFTVGAGLGAFAAGRARPRTANLVYATMLAAIAIALVAHG